MSTLQATIDAQLAFLDAQTRTYAEKVTSIRVMLNAVQDAFDSPRLVDLSIAAQDRHDARMALEALRADVLATQAAQLGTNIHPRVYRVPVAMPLWMVAKILFGDARRWTELLVGNAIHTPNMVRAGTLINVIAR